MPAYNSENYIGECIESVLNQSLTDFVFYIYNDGSTDNTESEILKFKDSRIIYKKSDKNIGYVRILNLLLSEVRSKYIARLDSDDVCYPERFQLQTEILNGHPSVGVCGSNASLLSDDPNLDNVVWIQPKDHDSIMFKAFFENPVIHPSVMFAAGLIKTTGFYNPNFMPAEDLDYWLRASEHTKIHNIQQPLIKYRLHPQQVSNTVASGRRTNANNLHLNFIRKALNCSQQHANTLFHYLKNDCDIDYLNKLKIVCFILKSSLSHRTKKYLIKSLFKSS